MARSALAAVAVAAAAALAAAQTLPGSNMPPLNVDRNDITVSGISSGGFMAVQLHVAFSATFSKGLGVLAGGPYWCAMDNVEIALTSCMSVGYTIDSSYLELVAKWTAYSGFADPTTNMRDSNVWVLSAQQDTVVETEVVKKLEEFYTSYVADPSRIKGVYNQSGEHSQLTLDYGNACTTLAEPFLNKCDFDAAGALLQHIFEDSLAPPPSTAFNGTVYSFDQGIFFDSKVWAAAFGMGPTGFVYVPKQCEAGTQCRLHVALHGCEMTQKDIGQQYVLHGGYNSWADANDMVVLYPQAYTNVLNPKGCFDWWSYAGLSYASNVGSQTLTIKRMVDSLIGQPRTPNVTLCNGQQEAALAAWVDKAQAVDISHSTVLQAGAFDDERLNAQLGEGPWIDGQRCWPSKGMAGFIPGWKGTPKTSLQRPSLRGL
ncbi:unnamed protein product [Symbiodinium sp. KB8]|nr:unnamed protein product [Symbiodinium sp. KB8]